MPEVFPNTSTVRTKIFQVFKSWLERERNRLESSLKPHEVVLINDVFWDEIEQILFLIEQILFLIEQTLFLIEQDLFLIEQTLFFIEQILFFIEQILFFIEQTLFLIEQILDEITVTLVLNRRNFRFVLFSTSLGGFST